MAGYLTVSDAIYLPARVRILAKSMELYRFQVQHPVYDPIIKTLLRSYTGLFEDYTRFSEMEIARRENRPVEEVKKQLVSLTKLGILDYLPATDTPSMTFIQPRIKESDLYIPKELLEQRKERFKLRVEAFRNFLTNQHQCRSIMLLAYFGESHLVRCGTCDFCRERNKLELNDLEVEVLSRELHTVLQQGPMPPAELSTHFPKISTDKLQAVVRWLLDNGELGTDALGRLYRKID